jgi:hypothetical protein
MAGLKEALAVLEGEALVPWLGQAPVKEPLRIACKPTSVN